jgi:prepilin-type N-terminal cleavage/methylation domain-containing protein
MCPMTPMKRIKHKSFTLLELMVCLAIIGLLGAVVGIKGVDLLAHHRFHGSLQTLLFDIQRAQILAMNEGTDVLCTIKKNKKGDLQASLEADSPSYITTSYDLKEASKLSLDGREVSELQLTLFSSGRISPSKVLKIEPKRENEPSVFLDLSYPLAYHTKPIKNSHAFIPPPYPEKSF